MLRYQLEMQKGIAYSLLQLTGRPSLISYKVLGIARADIPTTIIVGLSAKCRYGSRLAILSLLVVVRWLGDRVPLIGITGSTHLLLLTHLLVHVLCAGTPWRDWHVLSLGCRLFLCTLTAQEFLVR